MIESENKAKAFAEEWKGRGDEKSDTAKYLIGLLDAIGVEEPVKALDFEKRVKVKVKGRKFIDGYISRSDGKHVLIEMKSLGIDLDKPEKQSDDAELTPFEQGKRYSDWLPYEERARWIIVSNFGEIRVHDMQAPTAAPVVIMLEDLPQQIHRLDFIKDSRKEENLTRDEVAISKEAGTLVRKLYDALTAKYKAVKKELDATDLHNLNKLCVQLVFCFYAEDARVFGPQKDMFLDYIKGFNVQNVRKALLDLFKQLNTPPDQRDPFDDTPVAAFPYVNGGLFDGVAVIPSLDAEIVRIITEDCCAGFDWSTISPVIFGAIFESTMNQETRRSGGMHYTSVENIRKVIKPLFLDALEEEFQAICAEKISLSRKKKLAAFQDKLASLKFLDPACGSGNFLTQAYIELRRLENRTLEEMMRVDSKKGMQGSLLIAEQKVSITQFYGIEINDFAVSVAKTALWIAESQMANVTESIIGQTIKFLPLTTQAGIVEGNALRMDWNNVCSKEELNYIMGNPPFVGFKMQSDEQRDDIKNCTTKIKQIGLLDYVCGWYIKAANYINGTNIKVAFVSTNSITQGAQPAILWEYLYNNHVHINFAYRTFIWSSESKKQASVHCVIIGFSQNLNTSCKLIDKNVVYDVHNITPYLTDGPEIIVKAQKKPICDVPKMIAGNKTVKCLALIMTPEERDELVKCEPQAKKYIKRMIGAEEFINNIDRYCLWLVNVLPSELKKMPLVLKRVEQVRIDRLNSKDVQAHVLAKTPTTFRDTNNPNHALVIPLVSSERRQYIPIGYIDNSIIANNKVSIIPDGTIYHFGILTSNIHNAWMRCVAMRMKSDYSYSLSIVYNTFPWPLPTEVQRNRIELTAQGILDTRKKFPDSSLADLYDPLTMPPELLKAHEVNDRAVKAAYGYSQNITEPEIVADLFKRYQALTSK